MVHTTCAVRECMSSSRINKELRFHQFPHSVERCNLWVQACSRPDLVERTFESLKNTYICSLHFETHMYGRKSLKKTAIPTLLLPSKYSTFTQTDPIEDESIWNFFERETGGRARCAVCRASVQARHLRAHLRDNHPKLVGDINLNLGSDTETEESQEDMYTEIVYLEDEVKKSKKQSTEHSERVKKPRKRAASSSSDEELIKIKHIKEDNEEEIEQFGKYITCLLKKVPKDVCMELQMEIVNLIMKKQLELKKSDTTGGIATVLTVEEPVPGPSIVENGEGE